MRKLIFLDDDHNAKPACPGHEFVDTCRSNSLTREMADLAVERLV